MPRVKVATIEEFLLSVRAIIKEEAIITDFPPVEEFEDYAAVADAPVEEVAAKKPRLPAKAFDYKIVTADEITQDRYNELKNYAMKYKKLKSRVSKKYDSINRGRVQFVKFGLAGKTFKVYLNLDLNEVDPKFHCKDQSFKKPYEQVPVLIRVKSGRAVKYAKRLIDQTAERIGLKENPKYVPQDYVTEIETLYKANKAAQKAEQEAAVTAED